MRSNFRKEVLKIVSKIPKGKVLTYKGVAEKAGSPRGWRAVARTLSQNYDPKIPCHRVVRSDGGLGGYNRGAKNKAKLLKEERVKSPR